MSDDIYAKVNYAGLIRTRSVPADLINTAIPSGTAALLPSGAVSQYIANVVDYGATGDGTTDDGPAFQAAIDSLPATGGVVFIPPAVSGTYIIGATLRHPSYCVIQGSGPGSLLKAPADFVATADYGGGIFNNVNSASNETSFSGYRDFDITFENVWLDASLVSNLHCIFNRAVQRLRIVNCNFIDGGDGTACVTCDDVVIDGCRAVGQTNCCYDHWGGSTNCRVVNCYGQIVDVGGAQVVNFNGIRTSVGAGVDEVWHADGFVLANCDIYTNATQHSVNVEPLGPNATVKNVRIIGNRFYDVRVVIGGGTSQVVVANNVFLGSEGTNPTIYCREQYSMQPESVTVIGNDFIDCNGDTGNGIIEFTGAFGIAIANKVIGGTYDYGIRVRATATDALIFGNQFEAPGVAEVLGTYTVGTQTRIGYEERLEFTDNAGTTPYFTVDGSNIFYFVGTDAAGSARAIWGVTQRSSTSTFRTFINMSTAGGLLTTGYVAGLVATGSAIGDALVLTQQNSVVATTAAGTGVRLFAMVEGGGFVTIYNDGANTLNVYPPAGGQINGGGVGVPVTIASGASARYMSISANSYRTAA